VGLAFDGIFEIPALARFMRRLGEIPANPENAGRALDEGASVLVYPGGAYDAFRPWTERNQIDFQGHRGFIRLALRHGVPVVPVVAHGGHDTTVVLARGESLARGLGLRGLGMPVVPLLWQVPWGVSLPLMPGVPLPAKITVQVLPPMTWDDLGPELADDDETLEACYDEITGVMQDVLTELAEENPNPILRRLWNLLSGSASSRETT
jgi:1-acyl-sn-glycerol-3-phosphate acyltransferase